jgi:hypothetical protein
VKRVLLGVLLSILALAPAAADIRILQSPGGEIGTFLNLFSKVNESGQRVVIDGPCLSACTLVLTIVPRQRICVTRHAILGFHAAWSRGKGHRQVVETEATQVVLDTYPPAVKSWIVQHGGLHAKPIFLKGRELNAIYPACR